MIQADSVSLLRSFHKTKGFPGLPSDWEADSEIFENSNRSGKLFSLYLRKKDPAPLRRALIVVHGQGEHCGRYLHFPYFLDGTITDICLMDLRGHGRSEGLRGHIEKFDDYVEDLSVFVGVARERLARIYSEVPELHLFGHSMGGLIAMRLLLLRPELRFASASVTAPLLGIKMKVPGYKKALAYALASVWGSLQLGSEMDTALMSRDVNVQEAYSTDLLVHAKATPKFFTSLQDSMADTLKRKTGYESPLLIMVPTEDGIVDSEVTMEYAREIRDETKEVKIYPEFRHEILNEIGKEQAFEDLKKWIQQNSTKRV